MKNQWFQKEETKMKKLHKLLDVAVATTLCFATLFAGTSCKKDARDTIAVIAKGDTHAFWQAVKAGAEDAGNDYGYKVTFRGPTGESEQYVPEQREMLSSALSNDKTKAVVLATIGTGFTDELVSAFNKNIPIVEFDSGLYGNGADVTPGKDPRIGKVATDNVAASALVATNFFNYLTTNNKIAAGKTFKLGIIQHDATATGVDRKTGFRTKFEELATAGGYTYEIIEQVKTNNDGEYKAAAQALAEAGVDAIYMSNEGVVNEVAVEVVGANKAKYANILFCGFDCGTRQYEWATNQGGNYPTLVGSVAQDSYNIGYKAVEMAAKKLKGETFESTVGIAGQWYNADNIDALKDRNIFYLG